MNLRAEHESTTEAGNARRRLAFLLSLGFWSLMLISGFFDAIGRHVPNYPNAAVGFPNIGPIGFYVVIPSAFVLLNVLLLVFSRKFPRLLVAAILASQLVLLLTFLALSGGGV